MDLRMDETRKEVKKVNAEFATFARGAGFLETYPAIRTTNKHKPRRNLTITKQPTVLLYIRGTHEQRRFLMLCKVLFYLRVDTILSYKII